MTTKFEIKTNHGLQLWVKLKALGYYFSSTGQREPREASGSECCAERQTRLLTNPQRSWRECPGELCIVDSDAVSPHRINTVDFDWAKQIKNEKMKQC